MENEYCELVCHKVDGEIHYTRQLMIPDQEGGFLAGQICPSYSCFDLIGPGSGQNWLWQNWVYLQKEADSEAVELFKGTGEQLYLYLLECEEPT